MEWRGLGFFRFVLAFIVLTAHLARFTPDSAWTAMAEFSALAAVLGFLIISGYSIAHSITAAPADFYRRRVVRIMPLYALAIVAAYAVGHLPGYPTLDHAADFPAPSVLRSLQNLLFLQLFTGKYVGTNGVVWTLAVEVAFYVAAPLLVRLSSRILLSLAALSAMTFIIHEHLHLTYYSLVGAGQNIVLLGWPWLLGFWFYIYKDRPDARAIVVAAPLAICSLCSGTYLAPAWPLTILAVSVFIAYGDRLPLPRIAGTVARRLGDISYPLYLFHLPVMLVVADGIGFSSPPLLLLSVVVVSWTIDVLLDKPLTHWLRSLRPADGLPKAAWA